MKTMIRITTAVVITLLLFASGNLSAQKPIGSQAAISNPVPASISSDFIVRLPEGELSEAYSLDVKTLNFPSAEALDQFCAMFSFDFQTLQGDFPNKKITLKLDAGAIRRRALTKAQIEEDLESLSPRMTFYFQRYIK